MLGESVPEVAGSNPDGVCIFRSFESLLLMWSTLIISFKLMFHSGLDTQDGGDIFEEEHDEDLLF